jgi:2-isopropylmalate synthase
VQVLDYHEHAIDSGAQAKAAAYLELRIGQRPTLFGVGIDANILSASMKAVLSGMQRAGAMNVDHRRVRWATS